MGSDRLRVDLRRATGARGGAADLFGRRKVLTVGLVSFAVASAACGLASDMPMLIASRAVQGIAAALIAPASLSILTTSFREGRARNRVLGLYGITASVGFVVGLVAGGVLVDTVGWRGVFFVNVPICLAMAAIGRRRLPAMRSTEVLHHLDLAGALTAAAAMLVLAPSIGASDGWTSGALAACLIGGAVCLVAFVRRERRSRDPVVPLGIFRQRARVGGDIVAGLVGAWVAAEVLVVSLYSQEVLAYSALAAAVPSPSLKVSVASCVGSSGRRSLIGSGYEGFWSATASSQPPALPSCSGFP